MFYCTSWIYVFIIFPLRPLNGRALLYFSITKLECFLTCKNAACKLQVATLDDVPIPQSGVPILRRPESAI